MGDKLISSHPPNTQWHYIYILIIIMHMYNNHLLYNQFKTNAALFYLEKVVYEHLFLSLPFFYSLPSNDFFCDDGSVIVNLLLFIFIYHYLFLFIYLIVSFYLF